MGARFLYEVIKNILKLMEVMAAKLCEHRQIVHVRQMNYRVYESYLYKSVFLINPVLPCSWSSLHVGCGVGFVMEGSVLWPVVNSLSFGIRLTQVPTLTLPPVGRITSDNSMNLHFCHLQDTCDHGLLNLSRLRELIQVKGRSQHLTLQESSAVRY